MFRKYRMLDFCGGPLHMIAFESDDSSVILLAFDREVWERARRSAGGEWKEGMTASAEGPRSAAEVAALLPFIAGLGYFFMLQAPGFYQEPTEDYAEIGKYLRSL